MASEYLKPMLDIGSPRVLNCNVLTKNLLAAHPEARPIFRCKPLNNIVLIKDTDPMARDGAIGTKIYLPFNENDIYEGGRTIFLHDRNAALALTDIFGAGALPKDLLAEDMKLMKLLDALPSLDPFLLKDTFLNEKIEVNPAYFEVSDDLWNQIEHYILQGFEPLARAAFPDAVASEEVARKLIEKIWEGRDLDALRPLIMAFRLPEGQVFEIFAAWKGVIFYGFERQRVLPLLIEFTAWLKELKIPAGVATGSDRDELKAGIDKIKTRFQDECAAVDRVLAEYQVGYDKMFKTRTGSTEFVSFLQNSRQAYRILGNGLGKIGHALYCWDAMSKRFPGRKMPWESTRDFITLMTKIFNTDFKKN